MSRTPQELCAPYRCRLVPVGEVGSKQRELFEAKFIREMAKMMGIAEERLTIEAVSAD